MNVSDLKTSKFLKKDDVGDGILVTISGVDQQNVALDGAPEDVKVTLHFKEVEKPLVLNSTNGQLIEKITGVGENIETGWVGKQIVLYNDPNITYQGKLTGGIRVRAMKSQQAKDLPF